MRQLRNDWDLLDETAALNDDALRLQLRIFDLADTEPEAERLMRFRVADAPLSRLFRAIVAVAQKESAQKIEISFAPSESDELGVRYGSESRIWEGMVIPSDLRDGLKGLLRFVEAAGYDRVWPPKDESSHPLRELQFDWPEPDRLRLSLF